MVDFIWKDPFVYIHVYVYVGAMRKLLLHADMFKVANKSMTSTHVTGTYLRSVNGYIGHQHLHYRDIMFIGKLMILYIMGRDTYDRGRAEEVRHDHVIPS